jgi:hypothetical protein
MFRQLVFYMGEEVQVGVREFVESQHGAVKSWEEVPLMRQCAGHYKLIPSTACDIQDAAGVGRMKEPSTCPVVLESWVLQCFYQQRKVDVAPFCVSFPLGWSQSAAFTLESRPDLVAVPKQKRQKGEKYSVEEDELLRKCAKEHEGKGWTQEQLWMQVEERGTIPGRTASSMQQRYAVLSRSMFNKSKCHYSRLEVEALYSWAWAWSNMKYTGAEASIWAAAETNRAITGRKAQEMKLKYYRCVSEEEGGKEAAMEIGKSKFRSQVWRDVFTTKEED